jgi:hypothetical protein
MERKWQINFEDIVYLIICGGLFCLIIIWMLSVLLVGTESYDHKTVNPPSQSSIPESLPQKGIESHSSPVVSQQFTHALNIHPLKILRLQNITDTPPPSSTK